jgi:hypothetical protein
MFGLSNSRLVGSTKASITVLSFIFIGAYFVLRALPDAQCGFLHYVEIVNADGEIELCATNHAGFLDLTRLSYPVIADLRTVSAPSAGDEVQVDLHLETSGGMSIAAHELAVTHTEKMHIMLIDPSLQDYHHVHPKSGGLDGIYRFSFTPNKAGNYRVFTEIVPLRSRRQAIALSEFEVTGKPNDAKFKRSIQSLVNGVHFELVGAPEVLKTGRDYSLDLNVRNEDGSSIILETVMGSKGHMVAFDAEAKGFAHMHPVDDVITSRTAGLGGVGREDSELTFLFNVPNPGWYRLFAQIQVKGEALFGHFDLYVK